MMNQIFPCLWFDNKAKAAAEFYCSIFTNSKITTHNPLVVMCELEGTKIMGLNGGPMFKINPSISLFVVRRTLDEVNKVWDRLILDGKALMPIDKYPWSERYGWLQDRFGVTWQIAIADDEMSKVGITPSMLFTSNQFGRAEEAIKFYSSIFDNSSTNMMIHYPANDQNAGKVMYSEFKLNDYRIIAMDGPGVHDYSFNEATSFVINCNNQSEIDYYWEKLTDGGAESMCGWLIDKFGVSWQVVPTEIAELMSDPVKAERVTKAFMNMKKLDIDILRQA